MELKFEKRDCRYLKQAIWESGTEEQTQEIRLGDGWPDAGRIIGAWGQVALRGKEWRSGSVVLSGGVTVWVLYAPEDGSVPRCLDGWLPFKMKWDLPEEVAEGTIRVNCLLLSVDGRIISPRKILTRASVSVSVEALSPENGQVYTPGQDCRELEMLRRTYPVFLPVEAGEKAFQLDEEVDLEMPEGENIQIIACWIQPWTADSKVLTDKITFRGNADLHLICMNERGELMVRDFELPYSQFIQLDGQYSPDARSQIVLAVTSLEQDGQTDGHLRIKCGVVAQYLVSDREMLELTEDAYALNREVTLQMQALSLPAILESRTESISAEQMLPIGAAEILDCRFLPEQPGTLRRDGAVAVEIPGAIRILYRGDDGKTALYSTHWTGNLELPADDHTRIMPRIGHPCICKAVIREGSVEVQISVSLELTAISGQMLDQICAVELGEEKQPDPQRPSLILRRSDGDTLWVIAKKCGCTVGQICQANGLTEEPEPGKMLLIPVS